MGKIQVLPDNLVNQIAAGEVVERPASIVKELCENSLDAGAKSIRVELAEGGMRRILVADDGCGMNPTDARTCLERHATSKLVDAEGLKRIATYGFRGEAVPAIASVARFTVTTRERDVDSGTRIVVNGGKLESVEEVGAPPGTSMLVEDLFFNTPARRKFLKRAETEAGHASEALVRMALARPDVGFTLISGNRQVFCSPPSQKDPRERIAAALGSEAFQHLVPVDFRSGGIHVRGFVASPDYTLATTKGLYTFVNERFVRDRGLIAAVQRAFADVTMPGRQPAAVLFLEMPLEEVDVNVHPQKLEVRFADSRRVFDAMYGAIQDALRSSPWLQKAKEGAATAPAAAAGGPPPVPDAGAQVRPEATAEAFARYPSRLAPLPTALPLPFDLGARAQVAAALAPDHGPLFDARPGAPPQGFFHSLRVIGQFARTYLVCEAPGPELVVIDQHAAHERLKFHELRSAWRARTPKSQAFLFPMQIELPLAEARVLGDHLEEVRLAGFDLEPFGGTSFALKGVPAPLVGCDYRALLLDLAGEMMQVDRGRALEQAMEEVLATMACHAAVRAHQALSPEEARALLDALDTIDFSTRCPHGRPIAAQFSLAQLEKEVARR